MKAIRHALRSPATVVGALLIAVVAVVALFSENIAPGNPFTTSAADKLQSPSGDHLMGTDQLGRDIFTGVVRGAETSMRVVLGVLIIAGIIGLFLGALVGLRGGILDDVVMRVIDAIQSIPRFFLAILVAGWFGPGVTTIILLLGLTSWPFLARVVRAQTLSLREREFVDGSRALGASTLRVMARHILPNVLPAAVVVLALTASRVILLEASLAFLGLADPNAPSWGALINNAQLYLQTAWWMSVFPGAAITVAVLGMNLLADGLNQALNPMVEETRGTRRSPRPVAEPVDQATEGASPTALGA